LIHIGVGISVRIIRSAVISVRVVISVVIGVIAGIGIGIIRCTRII
tara:strand:+ start:600 stop:737 length:138 start_codon:yes stop_codon:yes gene_type:complete